MYHDIQHVVRLAAITPYSYQRLSIRVAAARIQHAVVHFAILQHLVIHIQNTRLGPGNLSPSFSLCLFISSSDLCLYLITGHLYMDTLDIIYISSTFAM